MRKLFYSLIFLLTAVMAEAQVDIGIFGGPQVSSAKYTVQNKKQSTESKYGFQLGASVKIPFEHKLYFSPAAFYSLKGYHVKLNSPSNPPDTLAMDNDTRIHTFELAALLQYDFSENPSHLFLRLGPSLDIQLFGKEKFNRKNQTTVEQDMVFSFTRYGRFAANLIMQFGYETRNGLVIYAQYSHGMGSMNNADFGPGIWHRVYGISLGKNFRVKK